MCLVIFPPSNHLTGFNTLVLAVHIHLPSPSLFSSVSEKSLLPYSILLLYSILAEYGSMKVIPAADPHPDKWTDNTEMCE